MKEIQNIKSWIESLPTSQREQTLEMLELIRKAHQNGFIGGILLNFKPDNTITFEPQKISATSLKKFLSFYSP